MARPADPRRTSADRYFTLPDDGHRYELIDGELVVAPAPNLGVHQCVVGERFANLREHVRAHRLGSVWLAPADVVLSAFDVVQPDRFFGQPARSELAGERLYGAPDLTVEVTSPTSAELDRGPKRRRYERFGVRGSWLGGLWAAAVEEFELIDGRYRRRAWRSGEDAFTPALLPGLTIDRVAIWPASASAERPEDR